MPVIAFFDVDNTLMRGTSIFPVGREAFSRGLIRARDIALFGWHQSRFIRVGENDAHLTSARERALGLVAGRTEAEILALTDEIWEHRLHGRLYPETVALAHDHLARGHQVWLVTATPWEVADVIARRLGLTGALGTRVETVDGVYTGRLEGPVLHAGHKARVARDLAERVGADLADCWAYSDSRNDLPLLRLVGHPVAINPDAALAHHARAEGWPVKRFGAPGRSAGKKKRPA